MKLFLYLLLLLVILVVIFMVICAFYFYGNISMSIPSRSESIALFWLDIILVILLTLGFIAIIYMLVTEKPQSKVEQTPLHLPTTVTPVCNSIDLSGLNTSNIYNMPV